jgi:ribonucleoside-triphosphate reductase
MSLTTDYQKFIHTSRYARWIDKDQRRERWGETVDRYFDHFNHYLTQPQRSELRSSVYNLEVMPSMRCLMTAGKALERDNIAGFNCAYAAIDHRRVFDEIMFILMCGTGVGFSVERQSIANLPTIPDTVSENGKTIKVRDSKKGWASSLRKIISGLYRGEVYGWDLSGIRPSGARLRTMGGRASGPKPLDDLLRYVCGVFKAAAGRKLTSLECHDIVCKIGDIVVVGGVRRSALISLSNLSDERMRGAKSGAWWDANPQRQLANNSAVYNDQPDFEVFLREMVSLHESKSGERGIFSRSASQHQAARNGRRRSDYLFGTNPCSEIILRSCQFCNLTEAVARSTDTLEDLLRKVGQAAILGTLQSTLTKFRYLRKIWRKNTEEEALLGVSITGIADHPYLSGSKSLDEWSPCGEYSWQVFGEDGDNLPLVLEKLKDEAVKTNKRWAKIVGVNQSTAITCVKPSGTVSQLVDSSSGIHSRYSPYYVRTVRQDRKDPLTQFLMDSGVPHEEQNGNPDVMIFSFPTASPEGAKVVADDTAIAQLKLWETYQEHWCEHKPSCTIYYTDEEFLEVGSWIYKRLDRISGVSFLPRDDHIYAQAPYQPIDREKFLELEAAMPKIDWEAFDAYETEDNTTGTRELACTGNSCEYT